MGNTCSQCCEKLLPGGDKPKPSDEEPPEVIPGEEGESDVEVDGVKVAGKSRLMTLFADGNIIELRSKASEKSVQIVNEEVDGMGEDDEEQAHFKVRVRRKGVVALQNVEEPSMWLKIDKDRLTGDGNGDEFCEFELIEKDGFIAFGSVKYPGVYVGINTQGEPRVPSITGTQGQALFTPTIKKPTIAGETEIEAKFEVGKHLTLTSLASHKAIRILADGKADGDGEPDEEEAQFNVHVRRKGVVALQNVQDNKAWLRIEDNTFDGKGNGDRFSEFKLKEVDGYATLESVRYHRQFVGIKASGAADLPSGWTINNTKLTPAVV